MVIKAAKRLKKLIVNTGIVPVKNFPATILLPASIIAAETSAIPIVLFFMMQESLKLKSGLQKSRLLIFL